MSEFPKLFSDSDHQRPSKIADFKWTKFALRFSGLWPPCIGHTCKHRKFWNNQIAERDSELFVHYVNAIAQGIMRCKQAAIRMLEHSSQKAQVSIPHKKRKAQARAPHKKAQVRACASCACSWLVLFHGDRLII